MGFVANAILLKICEVMTMEYETKYETSKEQEDGFIEELVQKEKMDRLWDYYNRSSLEVSQHDYRRKGEV